MILLGVVEQWEIWKVYDKSFIKILVYIKRESGSWSIVTELHKGIGHEMMMHTYLSHKQVMHRHMFN